MLTHQDAGTSGSLLPATINHVYNTNNKDRDIGYGYGWRINLAQIISLVTINNVEYAKYIDEDAWKNSNIFYRKYMSNPDTLFYINMDDVLPSFEKASKIIKEAGGLVFIPHIFEYRDNSEKILEYILSHYKIDGIECYYTTFTEEQTERLLNICKEKNLLISGGSDYHGKNKVGVEMGIGKGNLKIENNIIENW